VEVRIITKRDSPAQIHFAKAFPDKDLEPTLVLTQEQSWRRNTLSMMLRDADRVLTGFDQTSKTVLDAANAIGKPAAVVLETWPHLAVSTHGAEKMMSLYGKASAIFVPDEDSRSCLLRAGFDDQHLIITGNPAHDFYAGALEYRAIARRAFRLERHVPENAIVATWLMTQDLDDLNVHQSDHPEWYGISEVECVKEFLEAVKRFGFGTPPLWGLVRQKPSYGTKMISTLGSQAGTSVVFDNEPEGHGLPALFASDIVFGVSTSMLDTAALLGIPSIYYRPAYTGLEKMITTTLGLTTEVTASNIGDSGGLQEMLKRLSENPETLNRVDPPVLRKGAASRVADALMEMIAAPRSVRAATG
jgi:hypothetical protein